MATDDNTPDNVKLSMLQTLLEYLKTTPPAHLFIHMIYIAVVCFLLSTSYLVSFHWNSVVELYRESHDVAKFSTNFKMSVAADNDINTRLQRILDESEANRVYIYRYHNGLAAISGVPFFFQSNTHEVISPGTSRLMTFEQRIPASIHIAMNNEFVQDRCMVIVDTTEDVSSQNYYFYTSRNAKAMARCPIFMSNGDLFGFIGIDWSRKITAEEAKVITEKLHRLAEDLGSIFAGSMPAKPTYTSR